MQIIAFPTIKGKLSQDIAHCETFTIVKINNKGKIIEKSSFIPPPFKSGIIPKWLSYMEVAIIICGNIDIKTANLLHQYDIHTIIKDPQKRFKEIINDYLK